MLGGGEVIADALVGGMSGIDGVVCIGVGVCIEVGVGFGICIPTGVIFSFCTKVYPPIPKEIMLTMIKIIVIRVDASVFIIQKITKR